MTDTPLFTVGTPDGGWLMTATGLLGGVAEADLQSTVLADWIRHSLIAGTPGEAPALKSAAASELALLAVPATPWGFVDPDACWTLDALAERFPQARYLVFVSNPAAALARWLRRREMQSAGSDADAVMRRWHAGAAKLLRHAQRHRARCLLVDAAEARACPAALATLCSQRFELAFEPPAALASADSDPLALAIGTALAATAERTQALHLELQASCALLGNAATLVRDMDATAVMRAWRMLHDEQETLRVQQEALRTEADALKHTAAQQPPTCNADDAELLLQQLHQVQEELEHYYLAWRTLQEQASSASATEPAKPYGDHVERVVIGRERDTPPHRGLDVLMYGVHAADRCLATVQARLVEHHGRPGLALFTVLGTPTPLMAWQPNGSEEGRDYLLLVPEDALQHLQSLGCGDWALLLQLVDAIVAALQADDGKAARRWRVVAERLRAELLELPARLRYDRIEVSASADAAQAIEARLAPVSFGKRSVPELRMRWWPRAPQGGALELLRGADESAPPLARWPVDADGHWTSLWRLPLGKLARAERERAWHSLAPEDRALLLGLLDALPAVAERAGAELGTAVGSSASELTQAAALPLRAAQRALHGSRARRVLRALRGRIA